MKSDYRSIQVELNQGVAILKLNNPPVNQLSKPFVEEMKEAFQSAFSDSEVKAIILTGTEKNFIAGADITEIQQVKDRSLLLPLVMENNRFLNSIEQGPKPVIAAINGNCLGGGLEIAMACHYRIAALGIQVGQPEVQIGLIPGAGGTQRLPRLVGLPDALTMIATGQPISAEEGLKKGCVDEVVPLESLLEKARGTAEQFISNQLNHRNRMTRLRKDKLPNFLMKRESSHLPKMRLKRKGKAILRPSKPLKPWSEASLMILRLT